MSQSSLDQSVSQEETVFNFEWTGQIAGFSAEGQVPCRETTGLA